MIEPKGFIWLEVIWFPIRKPKIASGGIDIDEDFFIFSAIAGMNSSSVSPSPCPLPKLYVRVDSGTVAVSDIFNSSLSKFVGLIPYDSILHFSKS